MVARAAPAAGIARWRRLTTLMISREALQLSRAPQFFELLHPDVAAAHDRDDGAVHFGHAGERRRHGGGPGRLGDDLRGGKEPQDGADDLRVLHRDDAVDVLPHVGKRQVARTHRHEAVGDAVRAVERDDVPGND